MSQVFNKYHFDETERVHYFNRVQDCEDIVEHNKKLANEVHGTDQGRLIAMIPNVLLEKWIKEDNVNYLALNAQDFGTLIKRKLRDPDYRHLRTYHGGI